MFIPDQSFGVISNDGRKKLIHVDHDAWVYFRAFFSVKDLGEAPMAFRPFFCKVANLCNL